MARSVTGGTDVFAPGHIGELTQVIPPELVDAVLDETGAREHRLRSLLLRDARFGDDGDVRGEHENSGTSGIRRMLSRSVLVTLSS